MLPSYFDCIFGLLRQKAHLRPELSPKFLSSLRPNPNPTRKARSDLQLCARLSTTHGGGFTLSLSMLNVNQESCEYQFNSYWFDQTGNRILVYSFSDRHSYTVGHILVKCSGVKNVLKKTDFWMQRNNPNYSASTVSFVPMIQPEARTRKRKRRLCVVDRVWLSLPQKRDRRTVTFKQKPNIKWGND